MIGVAMVGWRNPARYLAPLALAAVVVSAYLIVHRALPHKHHSSPPAAIVHPGLHRISGGGATRPKAKFYVVRPNDTLSKISVRTGVPVPTLESLNPSLNPNALQPAQRLRLR